MITAAFNISKADALALAQHYYSSSATVRRSRILNQASVPVVLVLIAVLAYSRDPHYLLLASPFLVLAIVWVVCYPRLHKWYLSQTTEKMFAESAYEKGFGTYTLNLSETGIASSSPVGEGKYPWSSVTRISLTPDHLFIFLADPQGYAIPRAQVPEAKLQEIKEFAERMTHSQEAASPNGRPDTRSDNSGVSAGPPSAS